MLKAGFQLLQRRLSDTHLEQHSKELCVCGVCGMPQCGKSAFIRALANPTGSNETTSSFSPSQVASLSQCAAFHGIQLKEPREKLLLTVDCCGGWGVNGVHHDLLSVLPLFLTPRCVIVWFFPASLSVLDALFPLFLSCRAADAVAALSSLSEGTLSACNRPQLLLVGVGPRDANFDTSNGNAQLFKKLFVVTPSSEKNIVTPSILSTARSVIRNFFSAIEYVEFSNSLSSKTHEREQFLVEKCFSKCFGSSHSLTTAPTVSDLMRVWSILSSSLAVERIQQQSVLVLSERAMDSNQLISSLSEAPLTTVGLSWGRLIMSMGTSMFVKNHTAPPPMKECDTNRSGATIQWILQDVEEEVFLRLSTVVCAFMRKVDLGGMPALITCKATRQTASLENELDRVAVAISNGILGTTCIAPSDRENVRRKLNVIATKQVQQAVASFQFKCKQNDVNVVLEAVQKCVTSIHAMLGARDSAISNIVEANYHFRYRQFVE